MAEAATITDLRVGAYIVPTDGPESDGTLEWDTTTLVVVDVAVRDVRGVGYTYADTATATLVRDKLRGLVVGSNALDNTRTWEAMVRSIRNLGRPGIASMAISGVDIALWDLKAKLLNVSLVTLLGCVRDTVPVYGSGGFTSYDIDRLQSQLGDWVRSGITRVKMKVGRDPRADPARVHAAREAVGDAAELFVDANGAYTRKQALALADVFNAAGVTWFEEPVSSDDLEGLRLIRDCGPAGMDIAAGEYGYDAYYFRRMVQAGAVDVLQADATRCAGITGFVRVGALCKAHELPLSSHCAPSVHAHPACAVQQMRHVEYFHDHVRIESMLFDGATVADKGVIMPDRDRPGLGIELKRQDAQRYAA